MEAMTQHRAERLVRAWAGHGDEARVRAAAERMVKYGECVWHAVAQVTGKQCWCHDCKLAAKGK